VIVTLTKPPVDAIWRHAVTTPPGRLATLTKRARRVLHSKPNGLSKAALAAELGATEDEARDAIQALGREVVCYWPAKGWKVRLRSSGERRLLVAANDDRPRVWATGGP
jgi:hypothetical protein